MYRIYLVSYWTRLPIIQDPITIGSWLEIEGEPEYESDNLNEIIKMLETEYSDKVYKVPDNGGTKMHLCYIVNSSYNIVGALDFDKKVHIVKH